MMITEGGVVMNISGVSSAASISSGELSANVGMAVSVRVLDMAQDAFSDAAEQLIAQMAAAITGIGSNVDIYA